MSVRHESRRVGFNHADMKALARILSFDHNTSREWALDTACTVPNCLASLYQLRVGERDSGWSTSTARGLVDVGRRSRGGVEFALEVVQRDVVTDHVGRAVDAEVEGAACAGETTGWLGAVDDFFRNGVNEVRGGESEQLLGIDSVRCDSVFTGQVDVDL